jgi:hypothetical protein
MNTSIKRLIIATGLSIALAGAVQAGSANYNKTVSNGQSWSGSWQLTVPSGASFQTTVNAWGGSGGQVHVGNLTAGTTVYMLYFSSSNSVSGSDGPGTYQVSYLLGSTSGGSASASTTVTW